MTLEETIRHCKEKSEGCDQCAKEHEQLYDWLLELKELKKAQEPINPYAENAEITAKEKELYREIELFRGEVKIGEAEVELNKRMLARLVIYEPYQDLGFGTEALKMLTKIYNLDNLWVNAENCRAIHVYEKCGFKIIKPTMYEMVRALK